MSALLAVPATNRSLAAANDGDFALEIRPRVCVTLDSDQACSMELDIIWSASFPADVCLRADAADPVIRCWEQSREGELTMEYASEENYRFLLEDAASAAVLATADVTVVTRDLRNLRRRRRHVWSIL